ncbi:MAG: hypothetical protein K6F39_04280 [Lachnospiraceae bacterium]|nr:hypothetical protein [Lachnospiraceae bacterium]
MSSSILILGFIFEAIALVILVRIVTQNVTEDNIMTGRKHMRQNILLQKVYEHFRF